MLTDYWITCLGKFRRFTNPSLFRLNSCTSLVKRIDRISKTKVVIKDLNSYIFRPKDPLNWLGDYLKNYDENAENEDDDKWY